MAVSNIASGIVFLGWPDSERAQQQIVIVDFSLRFAEPPAGCVSDQLQDTHCYDTLTTKLKDMLASGNFRLLEHLGHEIYQFIKTLVTTTTLVNIRVKKLPPIANLKEGVFFHYGDENFVW
jgi:FolB domain-containing protein